MVATDGHFVLSIIWTRLLAETLKILIDDSRGRLPVYSSVSSNFVFLPQPEIIGNPDMAYILDDQRRERGPIRNSIACLW